MRIKTITLLVVILLVMALLCACGEKAKYEAQLKEYDEKLSSLYSEKEEYQNIYNTAKTTYQKYSKYSGKIEWDAELDKTKDIMFEAQEKLLSIERDILLYESFRDSAKSQLEKYE